MIVLRYWCLLLKFIGILVKISDELTLLTRKLPDDTISLYFLAIESFSCMIFVVWLITICMVFCCIVYLRFSPQNSGSSRWFFKISCHASKSFLYASKMLCYCKIWYMCRNQLRKPCVVRNKIKRKFADHSRAPFVSVWIIWSLTRFVMVK